MRIYLNNGWTFTDGNGKSESVRLPHTVKEIPYDYFDEKDYQMVCGYRRDLDIPAEWAGKKLLLTFEAAGHFAEVFVNGRKLAEHENGYTAFTVDITEAVTCGKNLLEVKLDTRESLDQPPFGYVIDYLCYGGLYREVYLEVKEKQYIADVFAKPQPAINQEAIARMKAALADGTGDGLIREAQARLDSEISLSGDFGEGEYLIRQELFECRTNDEMCSGQADTDACQACAEENDAAPACHEDPKAAPAGPVPVYTFEKPIKFKGFEDGSDAAGYRMNIGFVIPGTVKLWDVESPALYLVRTELVKAAGSGDAEARTVLDVNETRIGFRRAVFKKNGFYLNGRKVLLRGLDRHQAYPYVGYAMPESIQKNDADILKKELGLNAVRTSHYPQSHHFIDRCDELGLLVFTEIPGWQHIGGEHWQDVAVRNTEEMVLQYRNHPSIVLWGVRINESQDNDALYTRTNEAAHRLDPTRQTSGVRYLKKSSLLEDVYAYNDFSHEGSNPGCIPKKDATPDLSKGYLVSEYNGHMFPTKMFDDELHRRDHFLRHARVLNDIAAEDGIAGSFGWCFADYNTHSDFGSGDRICYHGVMDMFRNPKPAAWVYSAQKDDDPVLFVTSSMDIGEHPAGNIGRNYIVSNADSVRMYQNGVLLHEYTQKDSEFSQLKHGPVLISDYLGDRLVAGEGFTKEQSELCKDILNYAAIYSFSKLPPNILAKAAQAMIRYGLKYEDAYQLYGRYIQGWGDSHKEYSFEAVRDGEVVATVTKSAANSRHMVCDVSAPADDDGRFLLTEGATYDACAIRVIMTDQNDNQLFFLNEPVELTAEGPIEIIGPAILQLRGGAGGTYVKTAGKSGTAKLTLRPQNAEPVTLEFEVKA